MSNFIQEIVDRRVLQAVGVYVGGSWVLVEIVDRMVDRYMQSPYWSELVFWGLYSLLPAVALIAWTHGKPGRDRVTKTEVVGIPVNLIATVGLLVNLAAGKDFSAVADRTQIANEEGVTETVFVPRDAFRSRLALFFWENESGLERHDWLQYALPELLDQDLEQSPFILSSSPYDNWSQGYYSRMNREGFEDGLGLPLSLMRDIARESNRQYFITGDIGTDQENLLLTARIYDTGTLELKDELTEVGLDLLTMIDRLTVRISDSLDIPKGRGDMADNLPLSEIYGESDEELHLLFRAANQRLLENDFEAAEATLLELLEDYPRSPMGQYELGRVLVEEGRFVEARDRFAKAQEQDYRLPQSLQQELKLYVYQLSGDLERVHALLRMQVELRDDAESWEQQGGFQMLAGQYDDAIASYRKALERDPLSLSAIRHMSRLERARGNFDEALEYARTLASERPSDTSALLLLGDTLRDSGDLDGARDQYQRVSLMDDDLVQPLLKTVNIQARKGNWDQARKLLEDADAKSRSPQQKMSVMQTESLVLLRLGRFRDAIQLLEEERLVGEQILGPLDLTFVINTRQMSYLLALDDVDGAERVLAEARAVIGPPIDGYLSIYDAYIQCHRGDFDAARASLEKARQTVQQMRAQYLEFQLHNAEGAIASKSGDTEAAQAAFAETARLMESSIIGEDLGLGVSSVLAEQAHMAVLNQDYDGAERILDRAFKVDEANPALWLNRARLQHARGLDDLARASVGYALAIWSDADPEYADYVAAKALAEELGAEPEAAASGP